jgi:hypothetical protein
MTSSMLAPKCGRFRSSRPLGESAGTTAATAILDWGSPEIRDLTVGIDSADERAFLKRVHELIAGSIRPVYAMEDLQPSSRTVRRGRGSCSQRLAVLEAVARGAGIHTRVRGITVDGSFWYPRFPKMKKLVPDRVVLAWPEFRLGGEWVQVGELYGSLGELSACGIGFSNSSGETLFDAVGRTAIDWDGATGVAACDLSAVVREDLGYFDSRDDLFAAHGQTLAWLPRRAADQFMSRRSAAG